MVSKKISFFVFLFWFTLSYVCLQFLWFDILRLRSTLTLLDFLTIKSLFNQFGFSTQYFVLGLLTMLGLGILTIIFNWFRLIVLTVGVIIAFLFAALLFFANSQPCEGLGCIGQGLGMLIGGVLWMSLASLIPVAWALKKNPQNITSLIKLTILPGIISIAAFGLVWFVSTYPVRATVVKQETQNKQNVENQKQDFTYLQPTYLPKGIGKKTKEYSSIGVTTEYACGDRAQGLIINQLPLKNMAGAKSVDELEKVTAELNEQHKRLFEQGMTSESGAKTTERVSFNSTAALYVVTNMRNNYFNRQLIFYTKDTEVTLSIFYTCNINSPKEELIKTAESLQKS